MRLDIRPLFQPHFFSSHIAVQRFRPHHARLRWRALDIIWRWGGSPVQPNIESHPCMQNMKSPSPKNYLKRRQRWPRLTTWAAQFTNWTWWKRKTSLSIQAVFSAAGKPDRLKTACAYVCTNPSNVQHRYIETDIWIIQRSVGINWPCKSILTAHSEHAISDMCRCVAVGVRNWWMNKATTGRLIDSVDRVSHRFQSLGNTQYNNTCILGYR